MHNNNVIVLPKTLNGNPMRTGLEPISRYRKQVPRRKKKICRDGVGINVNADDAVQPSIRLSTRAAHDAIL